MKRKQKLTAEMVAKRATEMIAFGLSGFSGRNKGKRFRSAITGRFITAFQAWKFPKTTVREKV